MFVLVRSSRVESIMAEMADFMAMRLWDQESAYLGDQEAEKKACWCWVGIFPVPFIQAGRLAHVMVLPAFRREGPSPVVLLWNPSQTHLHGIFQVILNPVKLTVEIPHHIRIFFSQHLWLWSWGLRLTFFQSPLIIAPGFLSIFLKIGIKLF